MKTITPSPKEMEAYIARFADAQAAYEHLGPPGLSAEAAKEMLPHAIYSTLGPADAETAAVKFFRHGPEGIAYYICECDPGDGPGLHVHHTTDEIFTVLEGRFRLYWGDKGEHSVTLDRFDTFAVLKKVVPALRTSPTSAPTCSRSSRATPRPSTSSNTLRRLGKN